MRGTEKDDAAKAIKALAERYRVTMPRRQPTSWGHQITRLSGDDVELDEPALLLLALERTGHITSAEVARLHGDYLRAKYE